MQAVLPHMRRAKQGYLITITSTSGLRGVPCFEFYSGSKFALEGITDSMRYSLAELNISMVGLRLLYSFFSIPTHFALFIDEPQCGSCVDLFSGGTVEQGD